MLVFPLRSSLLSTRPTNVSLLAGQLCFHYFSINSTSTWKDTGIYRFLWFICKCLLWGKCAAKVLWRPKLPSLTQLQSLARAVGAVGQHVPAPHGAPAMLSPATLSPATLSPVTCLLPWRADLVLHTHGSRVALLCQGNLLSLWSSQ